MCEIIMSGYGPSSELIRYTLAVALVSSLLLPTIEHEDGYMLSGEIDTQLNRVTYSQRACES